jgi:hypothetical protein
MSFGKSSSTTTPELTQEQKDQIAAQTGFFTGTIAPTYQSAVTNATNLYNQSAGGVQNAAQNLAGTSAQAQQTLGSTGESALRTGVTGLESLFNPNYEANQVSAAMMPAQSQYLQNVANQEAQFGGTGQLGSARQALAGRQLAGTNEATQAQIAAQVQNNIANQRAAAAQSLAGIGQQNISGAQQAAGNIVTAGMTPQQLYNQYASVIFGTPSAAYNPNFAGTQGSTTNQMQGGASFGIKF